MLTSIFMVGSAPVAVFRRQLGPGQMCSCRGELKSLGGLQLLTAEALALWVASGNEYGVTSQDVKACGVYTVPWIILRGQVRVRLTDARAGNPELVETRTGETCLFACHLCAFPELPPVPGAESSSWKPLSAASSFVPDSF